MTPIPIIVLTIGIRNFSQNERTSFCACPRITPPPTQISGFFALLMLSITFSICWRLPFVFGLYPRMSTDFG